MNDQSNRIDTDQSNLDETANERRRLVRGAVALAPLVLTLRSGALAAASCTGAKTVNVTLDSNGKPPASVGAVKGDVCYKVSDVNTCPVGTTPRLENHVGNPVSYTIDSSLKCSRTPGGSLPAGTQVAILSSASANSFAR